MARLRKDYARPFEAPEVQDTDSAEQSTAPSSQPSEEGHDANFMPETPSEARQVVNEVERRALFAALSAGTESNLGRKPTVEEFVRLVDALAMARQLAEVERGLLYGDLEVHWNGKEWRFERVERNPLTGDQINEAAASSSPSITRLVVAIVRGPIPDFPPK